MEYTLKKYKVISIDMFQTLVCITDRKDVIWKRILKDDYCKDLVTQYSSLLSKEVINEFHNKSSLETEFYTLSEMFETGFETIFKQMGVHYNSRESAQIFIEEHNNSDWYDDSLEFLNSVSQNYKICLNSDADYDMISKKIVEYEFDHVIISENMKSYKKNSTGKMFIEIMDHYNIDSSEILHIGDSSSDIVGAMRQGIDCCYINRHRSPKYFDEIPKYSVKNLEEIKRILLTI